MSETVDMNMAWVLKEIETGPRLRRFLWDLGWVWLRANIEADIRYWAKFESPEDQATRAHSLGREPYDGTIVARKPGEIGKRNKIGFTYRKPIGG